MRSQSYLNVRKRYEVLCTFLDSNFVHNFGEVGGYRIVYANSPTEAIQQAIVLFKEYRDRWYFDRYYGQPFATHVSKVTNFDGGY